jgi:hypothetical protein
LVGQSAFLDGLHSISAAQFQQALNTLNTLKPAPGAPAIIAASGQPVAPHGLLLKDATLEDIVQFLHSKQIEPTFRHLIR